MLMSTIKQLLLLNRDGHGIKYISRHTGMSKNTVKSYLLNFAALQCSVDDLLKLDDPLLEGRFHGGNPSYSDDRHEVLLERMPYFMAELKRKVSPAICYGRSIHHIKALIMVIVNFVTICSNTQDQSKPPWFCIMRPEIN